jgi:hypothetical protein
MLGVVEIGKRGEVMRNELGKIVVLPDVTTLKENRDQQLLYKAYYRDNKININRRKNPIKSAFFQRFS